MIPVVLGSGFLLVLVQCIVLGLGQCDLRLSWVCIFACVLDSLFGRVGDIFEMASVLTGYVTWPSLEAVACGCPPSITPPAHSLSPSEFYDGNTQGITDITLQLGEAAILVLSPIAIYRAVMVTLAAWWSGPGHWALVRVVCQKSVPL